MTSFAARRIDADGAPARSFPDASKALAGFAAAALLSAGAVSAVGGSAVAVAGSTAAGSAPSASAPHGRDAVVRARFLMGAPLVIEATGSAAGPAIEAAFAEVARLEDRLSNWRPDSDVSRMNLEAGHAVVGLGSDLCAVVARALDWARATDGAFDPTLEPRVRALGLRGPEGRLPDRPAPPAAQGPAPVGWSKVRFDRKACTIAFAAEGMGIDLGGIGKGFALDAAAAVLRRGGVTGARLDFGGQVLVFGDGPDRGAWRVGIADPRDRDLPALVVDLEAGSLSTSGAGERRVPGPGGTPIGHLLDPATGDPIAWTGSVSVRADNATDADALSTALFVMGPARGLAWAAERRLDLIYLSPSPDGKLTRRGLGSLFNPTGDPNS